MNNIIKYFLYTISTLFVIYVSLFIIILIKYYNKHISLKENLYKVYHVIIMGFSMLLLPFFNIKK
jgi:hypothetical protein